MLLFLLPVLALLLGAEARLSAGTSDKWPSAAAQHGKDRSWNRFRDVSLHGGRGWGEWGGATHLATRAGHNWAEYTCACAWAPGKRAPLIHPVST